jgi:hypothetical protein
MTRWLLILYHIGSLFFGLLNGGLTLPPPFWDDLDAVEPLVLLTFHYNASLTVEVLDEFCWFWFEVVPK